ncbi:hypothetical protein [Bradyrhizobium sp. CCGUVB23]|uniref:hypothetical protein n=1 Tax=Bradyrhizobium sp. CCGUVB23 TaxID=2949630 RepID=UPI0020B2B39D|nr:hypothetical protein [Bradyrhizobium sp. CCGUVB23]MCP3468505.1 hypothetical protein [Bradyrhizobium sp. CCGUVB23]
MASRTAISANQVRRNRRFGMHQMDLFAGGIAHSTVGIPEWRELPKEAQDALVNLMTQLVLDHARVSATPAKREDGHDQ